MTDKQQPGDDGPPRGPVVQRDDGLWAIGWHEGAPVLVGLRSCASRLSPPMLVEQVDRLSRLTAADWERLKADLTARRVRVVALDLPTSWTMATNASDEFTGRMFEAINGMLLDMLAAVARKDYDDRRRRQAQGQAKAKAEGKYKGRPEDTGRNEGIAGMLAAGQSWGAIQNITGCSRATIAKIAKRDRPAA